MDWEFTRGLDDDRRFELLNPEVMVGDARGNFLLPELYFYHEQLVDDFEILPGLIIPAGDYRYDNAAIYAGFGAARTVSADISVGFGEFYDGTQQNVSLNTAVRPGSIWGVSMRNEYTRLNLSGGKAEVHVTALGLDITPHTRFAANTLLQWDSVSEEFGANVRLRWTISRGRDLFVSFNTLLQRDHGFRSGASQQAAKIAWNWYW
jgi:hypothetical protein